jgi:DNA-binding MarR family transcriptional regulator
MMNPDPSRRLPDCVCGSLRQASRAITSLYDDALRPAGLTAMQFQTLLTVKTVGSPTITELVEILTIDQTTLTRNLALLVRKGWLRTVPLEDRRSKAFSLTRSGQAILRRAMPLWSAMQERTLKRLNEADWMAARKVLATLIHFAGET